MHDTSCYIKVSQNVSLEKSFKHSQITYFQHEIRSPNANKQKKYASSYKRRETN